jgi:hypothetical protein
MSERPPWHALFAPLPDDAELQRKPIGDDPAIAGWESLSIHLSAGDHGLRHIMVVTDAAGRPLSAGDWLLVRTVDADGRATSIHDNVGGRIELDGRFHGTRWHTVSRELPDSDESEFLESTPSTPTDEDVAAIAALVADVLARATRS